MKYINDTQALHQDCGKAAASKESNNEDFKNSLWDLHEVYILWDQKQVLQQIKKLFDLSNTIRKFISSVHCVYKCRYN